MNEVIYRDLEKKHVLITGAATGIGKATTFSFLNQGCLVTGLDLNNVELSKFKKYSIYKEQLNLLCCDITKNHLLKNIITESIKKFGPINILVNNAGSNTRINFKKLNIKSWKFHISNNLDHIYYISRLVVPKMKLIGNGSIINMSSTAWMKLAPNLSAYHAAKAGVIGLTCGMASDLGPYFIRVNAVAPGYIETDMTDNLSEDVKNELYQNIPLNRLGSTEDVTDLVLFLSSEKASYITGQVMNVDGGMVM